MIKKLLANKLVKRRFRAVLTEQQDFLLAKGVLARSSYYAVAAGRRPITPRVLCDVCLATGVDIYWVLRGG